MHLCIMARLATIFNDGLCSSGCQSTRSLVIGNETSGLFLAIVDRSGVITVQIITEKAQTWLPGGADSTKINLFDASSLIIDMRAHSGTEAGTEIEGEPGEAPRGYKPGLWPS